MKRQKYPSSVIKIGAVLYRACGYEHDGRIHISLEEWVVRSIQRKRGSKSKFGFKLPESLQRKDLYVNVTQRVKSVTWGKRSNKIGDFGWLKSIPQEFREQFAVGENLPYGMYTTKLSALKHALKESQAEVRWYEEKIARGVPEDERAEYEQELDEEKRIVIMLKTRITRVGTGTTATRAQGGQRGAISPVREITA